MNIDCNLTFEEHVESILASAGKKLTALARMSHEVFKDVITNKIVFDYQFSYCPLIWMFCSRSLNHKINKLQERALRILYKTMIHRLKIF